MTPTGEHVDYALFGCFPAAVERDILIACAPRAGSSVSHGPGSVVADNLHPKYTRQTFVPARKLSVSGSSAGKDIPEDAVHVEQWHLGIDPTQLRWESYVKAGYYVSPYPPSFDRWRPVVLRDDTGCSEPLLRPWGFG